MRAAAATALRWTDEEHDILVQITNDQIALEQKDKSREIPWTKHWQHVSSVLQQYGHNRTPPACQGYWKRTIESQLANEAAAGPRWDDSEHQILLGMTEDQLELEKADPSAIIPWPRHWKKVSLRLKDNGYSRSVDACAAYWILIQNNAPHAARSDLDSEVASPKRDVALYSEAEEDSESRESMTPRPWTDAEHDNLARLLKSRSGLEKHSGAEKLSDIRLWTLISRLHQQSGYERTWEACKTYWEGEGEFRSSLDQAPESSYEPGESVSAESKQSSVSLRWSPFNVAGNPSPESECIAVEEPKSTSLPRSPSQHEMLFENHASSSHLEFLSTKVLDVSNALAAEESVNPEEEKQNSRPPQTAYQIDDLPHPKPKVRSFRFKSHQKAILEAEVAKNGWTLEAERRKELAQQLGVEEKSIRNWFAHFRHRGRRSQGGPATGNLFNSMDDADLEGNSRPESAAKRAYGSLDSSGTGSYAEGIVPGSHGGDTLSPGTQQPKKPRLEGEPRSEDLGEPSPDDYKLLKYVHWRVARERSESTDASVTGPSPSNVEQSTSVTPSIPPVQPISQQQNKRNSTTTPDPETATPAPPNPPPIEATITPQSTSNTRPRTQDAIPAMPQPVAPQPAIPQIPAPQRANPPAVTPAAEPTPSSTSTPHPPIPSTEATEKAWALQKIATFNSEVQNLEASQVMHQVLFQNIRDQISDLAAESEALTLQKEREIREIEERYAAKNNRLVMEMGRLEEKKEKEELELKKGEGEVKRKRLGIERFRALLDFYEQEGEGEG